MIYSMSLIVKMWRKRKEGAWKHTITANMVADLGKQKAFRTLTLHSSKSGLEVSKKAFVRLDFQQLLLFKNGRQLMLVNSIPAEADSETQSTHYPRQLRVNDWNKAMKRLSRRFGRCP